MFTIISIFTKPKPCPLLFAVGALGLSAAFGAFAPATLAQTPALTIAAQAAGFFQILPNPSTETGNYVFLVDVTPETDVKLSVQDEMRRTLSNQALRITPDIRRVAISQNNAPSGKYFIQLQTSTGTYVKHVVVP